MTVTSKKINETGVGRRAESTYCRNIFFVGINDTKRVCQHPIISAHYYITFTNKLSFYFLLKFKSQLIFFIFLKKLNKISKFLYICMLTKQVANNFQIIFFRMLKVACRDYLVDRIKLRTI